MDFTRILLGIFFLVLLGGEVDGQVLKYNNANEEGENGFKFDELPTQTENWDKFSGSPYYQVFIIYGDGNFERKGSKAFPINNNGDGFNYTYRDLANYYPGTTLLVSRKDDDDEPDEPGGLQPIISNPDPKDFFYISVKGEASSSEQINSNSITVENSLPQIPMINNDGEDWLSLGLSHYHRSNSTGNEFYYLQENSVHVFPIAYKPEGRGKLFFFYNNGENFEYYKQLEFDNNSDLKSGTILPNYYGSDDPELNKLVQNMESIEEAPTENFPLGNNLNIAYSNYLVHNILQEESDLLTSEKVVSKNGNVISEGELRLFHFIRTFKPFEDTLSDAKFLAVLYDSRSNHNANDLTILNDTTRGNFPSYISTLPLSPDDSYDTIRFADFALISAKKGEPDDPGGLTIKSICQCCNDFIVTFNLKFCNSEDATKAAKKVKIFLESYPLGNNSQSTLLTAINPLENCLTRGTCNIPNSSCLNSSSSDANYCYDYKTSYELAAGECDSIQFSAIIKISEVDRLINEPVMKYCVKFLDALGNTIDVGEFCRSNDVLRDTICQKITKPKLANLKQQPKIITCLSKPNPIWDDKIQTCEAALVTNRDCQNCKTSPALLIVAVIAMVIAGISILWGP